MKREAKMKKILTLSVALVLLARFITLALLADVQTDVSSSEASNELFWS